MIARNIIIGILIAFIIALGYLCSVQYDKAEQYDAEAERYLRMYNDCLNDTLR